MLDRCVGGEVVALGCAVQGYDEIQFRDRRLKVDTAADSGRVEASRLMTKGRLRRDPRRRARAAIWFESRWGHRA